MVADELVELGESGPPRSSQSARTARAARRAAASAQPGRPPPGRARGGSRKRAVAVRRGRSRVSRAPRDAPAHVSRRIGVEQRRRRRPRRIPCRRSRRARAPPARPGRGGRGERRAAPGSSRAAPARRATLEREREQLLEEERIAVGGVEDPRRAVESPAPLRRRPSSSASVSSAESASSRIGVPVPARNAGRSSSSSSRAEADDQDRRLASRRHVLDELEEARLGPVKVVEDEDERPARARLARRSAGTRARARRREAAGRRRALAKGIASPPCSRRWSKHSRSGQYVMPSPYERQSPGETVTAFARRASSAASRDLPTPAAPTTTTRVRRSRRSAVRLRARRRAASSRLRPTNGASSTPLEGRRRYRDARAGGTRGPARPFP